MEYEVTTRLNNLRVSAAGRGIATSLLHCIPLLELIPDVVDRMREPMPAQLRTLDALHLASLEFLREQGVDVELASMTIGCERRPAR